MDELVDRVANLLAAGDRSAANALVGTYDGAAAELGRAVLALADQDAVAAREHAHRAIDQGADTLGYIYLALAELVAGNAAEADQHARRAIEISPSYRARSTYASVLVVMGRPNEAMTLLRELTAERPDDVDVLLTQAAAALQLDDARVAVACYARAFAQRPSDGRPLRQLLELFAQLGRWLGAAAALDLAREHVVPADALALDMVHTQLVQLIARGFPERTIDDQTDQTIARLRASALRGTAELQLVVARRFLDLERTAEAKALLIAAAAQHQFKRLSDSELAELRFLEGVVAVQENDPKRALAAYAKALDADARRIDACANAITVLLEANDLADIPSWLERVPAADAKRSAPLLLSEAAYLARSGRPQDAIERLERVLVLTEGTGPFAQLATAQLARLR